MQQVNTMRGPINASDLGVTLMHEHIFVLDADVVQNYPDDWVPLADIDLGSWDFWRLDDDLCDGAFATLRGEARVAFFPQLTRQGDPPGRGHWALTRYEDVHFVSLHPEIFSSVPSITMADSPPEVAEQLGSMLLLDDPRHQRLRTLVSRAFTPKVLARTTDSVRDRARRLVSAMVADHPEGRGDLVAELAGPLPLQVICDLMGIPEEDHDQIFQWTNVILGYGDPDLYADFGDFAKALRSTADYAEDRRSRSRTDLTSTQVRAEHNGERLTAAEIASFFILLVAAGSETTRNAISHGVLALTRHPDQRQRWWNAFDELKGSAVEEIVRWATPVRYMRRTVTRDTELRGTRLATGDKFTMWYTSANRDEAKFPDPWKFDVAEARIRISAPAVAASISVSAPASPAVRSGHGRLRRPASPAPRHRGDGGARPADLGFHSWDRAATRQLDAAMLKNNDRERRLA